MSKKSLSSRLSRKEPDETEFLAAIAEFHDGSDRVAAIMGAGLVENNLRKIIHSALPNSTEKRALFEDEGAPFGTFKRKIVAGRAMNLFSERVAKDMDVIRDVRNQFAHSMLGLDFDNEHIKNECAKLAEYRWTTAGRKVGPVRLRYEKACWAIATLLITRANDMLEDQIKRLEAQNAISALMQGGANNVLNDSKPVEGGVED
jgi:hypothetical protein